MSICMYVCMSICMYVWTYCNRGHEKRKKKKKRNFFLAHNALCTDGRTACRVRVPRVARCSRYSTVGYAHTMDASIVARTQPCVHRAMVMAMIVVTGTYNGGGGGG